MTVLGVVVPARDEALLLPRCLAALESARLNLHAREPSVQMRIVVVLDSCQDQSAAVVAAHAGVNAVAVQAMRVGAARQCGVDLLSDAEPQVDWFANTDADSAVPPDWLSTQLAAAREGVDVLLGSVRPEPAGLSEAGLAQWQARHDLGDGHRHVFGANLGFSRRTLLCVGGFQPLRVHEDVDLTRRAQAAGLVVKATGASPVVTSARRVGRTPSGFASYLRHELIGDS